MKTNFSFKFLIIIVLASFFSCSSEDGADGTNGTDGTDGTDGLDGLIYSNRTAWN